MPMSRADVRQMLREVRATLYLAGRNQALSSVPRLHRNASEAIASEPAPRAVTEADVDQYAHDQRALAQHIRADVAAHPGWSARVKTRWLELAEEADLQADALDREAAE